MELEGWELDSGNVEMDSKESLIEIKKREARDRSAAWYVANKDRAAEYGSAYRAANKEKISTSNALYRGKKKEELASKKSDYVKKNKQKVASYHAARYSAKKEEIRKRVSAWKRANPHKVNALKVKREADRLKATPLWVSALAVELFYKSAREKSERTGDVWHVDHIVPLRSKLVCGLHCEFNLQVISGEENMRKSNRHWPDMP